ncbi:MAG: recombination protein O N-terminal domain-containing protein [bacterium]|nr:recombination protein O N-terminal domain-containing protein [bacterium]MDZ4284685.1 recombination protein O N-terminal domain-containing protein [Patescibacteria group bacterium]
MSYHRYMTEALVLGSEPSGEASRRVVLFTRSCGLVYAHAQGARLCRSRLRPHLATLSRSRVSLVRGRETWRLVGALTEPDEGACESARPGAAAVIARLAALVRRLVPQDAPDEKLFERVAETVRFVVREDLREDELALVEVIGVSRVLFLLGYLDAGQPGAAVAAQSGWDRSLFSALAPARAALVGAINEALAASHL